MGIEIIKGLGTTFKHIFQPSVTVEYPDEKRPVRPRFKGRHVLKRYDNGLEKCIGCALCAAACPADWQRLCDEFMDLGGKDVQDLFRRWSKRLVEVGTRQVAHPGADPAISGNRGLEFGERNRIPYPVLVV